ncbi:hypothetical protein NQ314_014646 [Rhamnusium bicolor]|uniref:Reverse transcriptase domain-containing protein n=1 Tax=Rhamnusium bicolor TaxID=1586634 RepID=A0AAV8X229_9CUCU|nr:hypothetical protein NQ314_014646 [Rhamnusium bicolor]
MAEHRHYGRGGSTFPKNRAVGGSRQDVVAKLLNQCLVDGEFPSDWKTSRLVLIEKPRKDPTSNISYRPICLLDSDAKLLELMIKGRLVSELDEKEAIHDHQYGFRTGSELEDLVQHATNMVAEKMGDMGIKLAPKKTEIVLLYGNRKIDRLEVTVAETRIENQRDLKYLGINIDQGKRMTTHAKNVCMKANKKLNLISRILPNIGGPKYRKRKIITSTVMSIILYGASIWKEALRYKHYENMLEQLNRKLAIKVIAAYRTIPTEAALALAGMPPIKLKVQERASIQTKERNKKEARMHMLLEWQGKWENYEGWVKVFINDIIAWNEREWGTIDYYLAQAFTGHGVFGTYLKRIGKQEHSRCWFCDEEDTAEHTVFRCVKWIQQREALSEKCEKEFNKENVAGLLLESEENWKAIAKTITAIMKEKEDEEYKRGEEKIGNNRSTLDPFKRRYSIARSPPAVVDSTLPSDMGQESEHIALNRLGRVGELCQRRHFHSGGIIQDRKRKVGDTSFTQQSEATKKGEPSGLKRYPELTDVKEEFEILEQITRARSQELNNYTCRTIVKITQNGTDEDLWKKLTKIRDEVVDAKWIAMHHVECVSPLRL